MCQKALKKCTTQCRVYQLLDLFHHVNALFALLRVGCNTIKGKLLLFLEVGADTRSHFALNQLTEEGIR